MRLLALLGYPRADGHTARMTDLFLAGAVEAGAEVQSVNVAEAEIRPCLGCYCCWLQTPGVCVHADAMPGILRDYLAADLLLAASPLYAYSISSHLKRVLERTLPLMAPGVEAPATGGLERNRLRYPGQGPRRMAGLLVGGLKSLESFEPAAGTLRLYAASFGLACAGILLRPESYLLQFPAAKPRRFKVIESAFRRAGLEFVRQERLEDDTIREAAEPLAADLEHFARYADVYWEHAAARPDDLPAAGVAALEDLRILIREMARNVSPAATRGVTAELQFEFPDRDWVFVLTVQDGTCRFRQGRSDRADLTITCPSVLWADVLRRRVSGGKALAHPECRVTGDRTLLRRLERWFPPPSD